MDIWRTNYRTQSWNQIGSEQYEIKIWSIFDYNTFRLENTLFCKCMYTLVHTQFFNPDITCLSENPEVLYQRLFIDGIDHKGKVWVGYKNDIEYTLFHTLKKIIFSYPIINSIFFIINTEDKFYGCMGYDYIRDLGDGVKQMAIQWIYFKLNVRSHVPKLESEPLYIIPTFLIPDISLGNIVTGMDPQRAEIASEKLFGQDFLKHIILTPYNYKLVGVYTSGFVERFYKMFRDENIQELSSPQNDQTQHTPQIIFRGIVGLATHLDRVWPNDSFVQNNSGGYQLTKIIDKKYTTDLNILNRLNRYLNGHITYYDIVEEPEKLFCVIVFMRDDPIQSFKRYKNIITTTISKHDLKKDIPIQIIKRELNYIDENKLVPVKYNNSIEDNLNILYSRFF